MKSLHLADQFSEQDQVPETEMSYSSLRSL